MTYPPDWTEAEIREDREEWRPILGYEGLYEASSQGRIRGLDRILSNGRRRRGRVLRPTANAKTGYMQVSLCRDGKVSLALVHRAVLGAFAGPCPDGMESRHLDGNRQNCNASNLQWGTKKANAADRVLHGTDPIGQRNPHARLTEDDIRSIRSMKAAGVKRPQIARAFGIAKTYVDQVVRGACWSHVP